MTSLFSLFIDLLLEFLPSKLFSNFFEVLVVCLKLYVQEDY